MAQPPTTHAEVGHGGGEAHAGGFPPFDSSTFASQLLWLAITFVALLWVVSKVILPRIGGILEARSDRIARDLAEAQRLKAETDAALAAYEQSLAAARARAQAIATETRAALNADMDAKRAAAEASLGARLAEAENRIGEIKARALGEVGSIAIETAEALVSALTSVSASRDEVAGAVGTAMAK